MAEFRRFGKSQNKDGASRSTTIDEIESRLGLEEGFELENSMLQLVDTGVISQVEYQSRKLGYEPNFIDTIKLGENTGQASNISFSDMPSENKISRKTGELTIAGDPLGTAYREELLKQIMIGHVEAGDVSKFDVSKGYQSSDFNGAYNDNESFRDLYDTAVEKLKDIYPVEASKATISKKNLYNTLNGRILNQDDTIQIRKKSAEKRGTTTPKKVGNVQIYEAQAFGD